MNNQKKITDEQLKRESSFDLYGRYAIIRNIINNNRKSGENFRVLDVGGRGNLMRRFLPEDDVFYLDPYVDTEDDNYVEGDGCKMPIENESYDWVVSADVFEHIPKEKREDFLRENIRVAKTGVVLAAPFYSKEVSRAEINSNESYKILSGGEDYIWLKEHIENGLPEEVMIERYLKDKGYYFQKIHNNRLFLWELLIGITLNVTEVNSDGFQADYQDFNYFYNSEVFPYDSEELSYRKVYFIKKDSGLKDIQIIKKNINDVLFLDTIKRCTDIINKIDIKNRIIIKDKDQIIWQKEEELKKKDGSCKYEIEEAMAHYQNLVKEEKEKNRQKDQAIQQKERELRVMKSSKFWKLRKFYLKVMGVK